MASTAALSLAVLKMTIYFNLPNTVLNVFLSLLCLLDVTRESDTASLCDRCTLWSEFDSPVAPTLRYTCRQFTWRTNYTITFTLLTLFTAAITNSKNDRMGERANLSPSNGDRCGNHISSPVPHNLPNKNDDVNRVNAKPIRKSQRNGPFYYHFIISTW